MEVSLTLFKNFCQFKDITSPREDLITFLVHHITSSEWIDKLYYQLKKVQNIKNSYRRKDANDKLYGLITYLKDKTEPEEIVNYICFIDKEIHLIKIPKKPLHTLTEFLIRNYNYYRDGYFRVDIFQDIFHNQNWKHVIEWSSKEAIYYKMTQHKKTVPALLPNDNLKELSFGISKLDIGKTNGIVHGSNSKLKNLEIADKWSILTIRLSPDELINEFRKITLQNNNQLLEKVFQMIKMGDSKLIIGEVEMTQAIEYYMVKEVFCSEQLIEKIKSLAPTEYYNFNIIMIGSLCNGDYANIIERDYGGYIGVKYY